MLWTLAFLELVLDVDLGLDSALGLDRGLVAWEALEILPFGFESDSLILPEDEPVLRRSDIMTGGEVERGRERDLYQGQ